MALSIAAKSPAADFEKRARRAELLAATADAVRDPLLFVAALCREQSTVALAIEEAHASQPLSGRLAADAPRIISLVAAVIRLAAGRGPAPLAEDARKRQSDSDVVATERLLTLWSGDNTARDDYLGRAMLRPYVEVLRTYGIAPDRIHRQGHCPFCGGAPAVSARKEMPDSAAAARTLFCGLCGCEWTALRGVCPVCGELDPAKLPIFTSDAHPTVRIESCETCRRYVKSIDLTVDARMVPEIDEIVSLSMDLWAIDEGLTRIEPGLAGL